MSDVIKIGVSGNKGSFTEEAANHYCSVEKIENYELDYLVGVEKVLQGLDDGKIEKAVFPVENSNGGIVYETVYAVANHIFNIEKIFEIDIKMNLMALPGTKKEDIKKIISHPQALKQCRMYLKRNWTETELEEYTDTASAAKDISEGVLPKDSAAIAPRICSEMYGLDLIEEGIQDLKFNFTTFMVATKK